MTTIKVTRTVAQTTRAIQCDLDGKEITLSSSF